MTIADMSPRRLFRLAAFRLVEGAAAARANSASDAGFAVGFAAVPAVSPLAWDAGFALGLPGRGVSVVHLGASNTNGAATYRERTSTSSNHMLPNKDTTDR
eukprot:8362806-Pyramimonas_sp.AAC.1